MKGYKKPQSLDSGARYDDVSCGCGKHSGVGIWNHFLRAQKYAWYRDKYKAGYDENRRAHLESYEKVHGPVYPNI